MLVAISMSVLPRVPERSGAVLAEVVDRQFDVAGNLTAIVRIHNGTETTVFVHRKLDCSSSHVTFRRKGLLLGYLATRTCLPAQREIAPIFPGEKIDVDVHIKAYDGYQLERATATASYGSDRMAFRSKDGSALRSIGPIELWYRPIEIDWPVDD